MNSMKINGLLTAHPTISTHLRYLFAFAISAVSCCGSALWAQSTDSQPADANQSWTKSGESHDDYDNSVYWCLKTMKDFGPDGDFVAGQDCRNPSRSCYEPT